MKRTFLILFVLTLGTLFPNSVFSQDKISRVGASVTVNADGSVTVIDASGKTFKLTPQAGAAPTPCSDGQFYARTNVGVYYCTNTTWALLGSGGAATIPSVTNLIAGDGAGNGADSGIAPSVVVQTTRTVNSHPLSTNVTVSKSDLGLGNADNTSDVNKPVSAAQQTALNLKQNTITLLGLNFGGTHTDLSSTGGANQVVMQESAGGDFTVRVLGNSDIPSTLSSKAITTPTRSDDPLNSALPGTCAAAENYSRSSDNTKWVCNPANTWNQVWTSNANSITDNYLSLAVKPAVTVVATSNQTLSGTPTLDGVTTVDGSVILATAQSTGSQNGPWVAHSGAWTRPTWYTAANTTQAFQFITTFVRLGTTYQGSTWRQTAAAPITIDTTATTWAIAPLALNTNTVTGIVPVANGGTNCSAATITCFNNITGFSAAGTTGTTSTNLVFSTSPVLTTPNLGTPSALVLTNATGLPATGGGTGQSTYAKGDILASPGSNTLNKLAVGTDGQVLTADAASTNGVKWAAAAGGGTGANPSASVGLTAVNGSASTFLRSDGAPALDVTIAPTWTGVHTFNKTVNVTAADAVLLTNTTAAAVGAQQFSPSFEQCGNGWKTTATAASQQVCWRMEITPLQNTTNPGSVLNFSDNVNGGAYTSRFSIFRDLSAAGLGPVNVYDSAASNAKLIASMGSGATFDINANNSTSVIFRARGGGSAVLIETDPSGTANNDAIGFGAVLAESATGPFARFKTPLAARPSLAVDGITSQTADIFQVRDNSANVLFNVTSGGNVAMAVAKTLSFTSGTNTRAGNAVLVGGTVTVSNTTVTANTIVLLTRKTSGGTIGTAITYTLSAGTSFTISSDNILDTSTFSYVLIENP